MSGRSLRAWINQTELGTLTDIDGIWCFQYAKGWLENPNAFALSPHLPLTAAPQLDGSTRRPVQWYFDNLLPEEGQRVLLAKDANVDDADAFGLLGYYGAESAGSITLLAADVLPETYQPLRVLTDEALQTRILQMPKVPLTRGSVKRMSLAGAQHKLAVVLQEDALFEPAGSTPSTHILKPDHPDVDDYPHSVINEWFVMRLAKRLGLNVPDVHRRYVPAPVYLIDRFDRTQNAGVWQRQHAIDACQLLGLDRSFKYAKGSVESLLSLANACRSPAVARTRLFSWLVFNVLTGNADAHLKNLSFLVSNEGVQLSPHYDLLSVAAYDTQAFGKQGWPDLTQLAWPLLTATRFADVTRDVLIEAGGALGLPKATAERLLNALTQRVVKEAAVLYAEVETQNATMQAASPELSATLAGECRCLRAIIFSVIKEMAKRLG